MTISKALSSYENEAIRFEEENLKTENTKENIPLKMQEIWINIIKIFVKSIIKW